MTFAVNPFLQGNPFMAAVNFTAGYYREHIMGSADAGASGSLYGASYAFGSFPCFDTGDILSGRFSAYHNALIARARAPYRGSSPQKREEVPLGTDDPNYAGRMHSYFNERVGRGSALPIQGRVLNNLLGPKCEDGVRKEEKKSDDALREMAELAYLYRDNPEALAGFYRRWSLARDDAERSMAFFDPLGDGAYLKFVAKFMPELRESNDKERMFEEIGAWLRRNCSGALDAAGGRLLGYAASHKNSLKGLGRNEAISLAGKLEKVGMSKEESEQFVSRFSCAAEAREAVEVLLANLDIRSESANVNELKEKIANASRELDAIKKKDKENDQEKETRENREAEYKRAIENYERQLGEFNATRARRFLQALTTSRTYYLITGHDAESMGFRGELPDGVETLSDAIDWIR